MSDRTLSARGIPLASPGDGCGSPKLVTMGKTPAHVGNSPSGEPSSLGGPTRTFADASSIGELEDGRAFQLAGIGSPDLFPTAGNNLVRECLERFELAPILIDEPKNSEKHHGSIVGRVLKGPTEQEPSRR